MPRGSRAAGARRDEWQQLPPTLQLDESVEAGPNASVAVTFNADSPSPRERRHKDDEATKWPRVDWLKEPDASISMVWRWFHLPSYFAERHKKEADLMRDLQKVKQKIVAEPGMTKASVRKIRRHTERLADTTSALRATRGYSATVAPKKVPFDWHNAKLDAGWPREPRSDNDEEVRLYSIWATTPAELGNIGGVGLRLYFFILKFLAGVFFAMGFITARADTFWVALIPRLSVCLPACLPAVSCIARGRWVDA
eukprot:COSAG01_NODE_533_length_15816_cov_4.518738_17_plen_254_part_00